MLLGHRLLKLELEIKKAELEESLLTGATAGFGDNDPIDFFVG